MYLIKQLKNIHLSMSVWLLFDYVIEHFQVTLYKSLNKSKTLWHFVKYRQKFGAIILALIIIIFAHFNKCSNLDCVTMEFSVGKWLSTAEHVGKHYVQCYGSVYVINLMFSRIWGNFYSSSKVET